MDDSLLKLSSSDMLEALKSSVPTKCSDKNDRQISRDVANNSHHYQHNPRHNYFHQNHNKYYYHNFHLESSSPSLSKSLHKSKRRRFNSASLGHRTHKRFEYIQELKVLLFVILSLITIFAHINNVRCLDSPVKVQRSKQQNKQQLRQQPFLGSKESVPQSLPNLEFVEDSSSSSSSSLNDSAKLNVTTTTTAARYGRARRTDERSHNIKQQQQHQDTEQCPSNKLSQSLLPPEYIGSPATSQRQHLSRAYCDCTVDLYGWHLTCFAGSASQQRATNIGLNLPNQLHPAFRAPQLQRQQQQAAAAATANLPNGRRIHRRSTSATGSRWMGDPSLENSSPDLTDKKNGGDNIELADSNSNFSSHEGFGEEVSSATPSTNHQAAANSATTTTTTNSATTAKLKVRKINSRSNFSKPTPEEATNVSPANSEDGLMSLASSNSFALLQLQENSEQQQKVAARSAQQQQQEKPIINHSSSSSHITFQTIPVLFSVKYIRNNMIEIDCDQAAPHYKPAMFQGKFW